MAANHEDLVRILVARGFDTSNVSTSRKGLSEVLRPYHRAAHGLRMTIRNARLDIPKRAGGSLEITPRGVSATAHPPRPRGRGAALPPCP